MYLHKERLWLPNSGILSVLDKTGRLAPSLIVSRKPPPASGRRLAGTGPMRDSAPNDGKIRERLAVACILRQPSERHKVVAPPEAGGDLGPDWSPAKAGLSTTEQAD